MKLTFVILACLGQAALGVVDPDKAFKICSVSGGLDVTRLVSSTTRSFFQSAIEDVELIREVISESAYNGGIVNGIHNLDQLSQTLAWEDRSTTENPLTAQDTTVTAGLGYVDDRPSRHIERYVSLFENFPFVGDKEADLAMVETASNIFPWIIDRRSVSSKWWLEHQNGRVIQNDATSNSIEQLYTAAWIGTKGEAWLYYPPLTVYGHPLNFGDVLGSHYDSREEEFVKPNFPEKNPERISYFTKPYPDTAVPGLSLITAQAPVYYTGTFKGYEYKDTYIASTGVDIAVSSVSSYLDILQQSLTPNSFGMLVDADFHTIVISEYVTQKIYPTYTGNEESRITYDPEGNIVQDRRNKPYLPSDTILQPLVELSNADWEGLRNIVRQADRGERDFTTFNVTTTGQEFPTEFHVMFERWENVADWVLLVFVPLQELDQSIAIAVSVDENHRNEYQEITADTDGQNLILEGVVGDTLHGSYTLVNRGNLDALVSPRSIPSWVTLAEGNLTRATDGALLKAGESLLIEFDVSTLAFNIGTQSSALTFRIQDAYYPDCLFSEDMSLQLAITVTLGDCDASSQTVDAQGNCVCLPDRIKIGSKCITIGLLIGVLVVFAVVTFLLTIFFIVWHKSKRASALWKIDEKELKYDSSLRQIGRGGFGVVHLAEYRGTTVAVKKLNGVHNGKRTATSTNNSPQPTSNQESSTDQSPAVYHRPTHNTAGKEKSAQEDNNEISHSANYSGESNFSSINRSGSKRTSIFQSGNQQRFALSDFAADMRLLCSLRHPCITTVMGAVVPKKSEPLLVMEYMEHRALSDVLQKSTVELDAEIILGILRDITQGIQFLHNAKPQVVHGDVKSHNVLIDSMFRAKVSDFGISYKVGVKGTPLWMAPEILRDESDCTSASDVYSFGILLYEIYARKDPYDGEDYRVVLREVCDPIINRRPNPPSNMPTRVAALMHDCLVSKPEERPSMDEIVSRIRRFSSRDVKPVKAFLGAGTSAEDEEKAFQDLLKRFPRNVAEDLRDGREVAPENHDCVSVLVSDIVDFDKIATQISQKKLFTMIKRVHRSLDRLAEEKEVFKIETTGETWMGVTNCARDQSNDHAKIMAEFAIAAVESASCTMIDSDQPGLGFVQLRVAFHSGQVLSNVVGAQNNNPRYTLFGDTVNTAMRILHKCKPGLVLCSATTASLLNTQASSSFETSCCENETFLVNAKGQRAMAAFDRVRKKQKLRLLKQQQRSARKPSIGSSSTCSWSSIDTADLSMDEDLNQSNHNASQLQIDFASEEMALELGMDDNENDLINQDDEMSHLAGSLKHRLSRNYKEVLDV